MQEYVYTLGMIIRTQPQGDFDRRVVILTKDYGKITAFAKGARRQTNRLVAKTDYFCFGEFKLYPGRNSYSLEDVVIHNSFQELRDDYFGAFYGMYFLEVMDYLTKENNDEKEMLKLLYQSLRAILSPNLQNELVKTVFELKSMVLSGEYKPSPLRQNMPPLLPATLYAEDFVIYTPVEKLYTFNLKPEVLDELKRITDEEKHRLWQREFKTEEMIQFAKL